MTRKQGKYCVSDKQLYVVDQDHRRPIQVAPKMLMSHFTVERGNELNSTLVLSRLLVLPKMQ